MAGKPGRHLKRMEKLNTTECLWLYILKILSDGGPSHAYVLRKEIEELFGFRPGTVTAYKVLYDLQQMGLVTKKSSGMKQIYAITEAGRGDLKRAVSFYRALAKKLG